MSITKLKEDHKEYVTDLFIKQLSTSNESCLRCHIIKNYLVERQIFKDDSIYKHLDHYLEVLDLSKNELLTFLNNNNKCDKEKDYLKYLHDGLKETLNNFSQNTKEKMKISSNIDIENALIDLHKYLKK